MRIAPTVRLALVAALTAALTACGGRELPALPPAPSHPVPDPAEVESVLLLMGDPGKTEVLDHPILLAMERDVERWSRALDGDTSVAVVVMGDVIYPYGLRPADHPEHAEDSVTVARQVRVVSGPAARERARMYFVAGNHDWGREEDWEGTVRLRNLEVLLDTLRARGLPVSLEPEAGHGGPTVVDVGRGLRLILLDTAWWLLDAEPAERTAILARIGEALRTAGDRAVVFAAHHPFESAGSHGGYVPFWKTLGVRHALYRAGALLQDLSSRPYQRFREGLGDLFAEHGRPLLFAGGHDHSLQVIRHPQPRTPVYSVVAGSASKLTEAGHVPGMRLRETAPGYARVFVLKDGGVILTMEGAPPEFLECTGPPETRLPCMEEGADAYRTLWSDRIR